MLEFEALRNEVDCFDASDWLKLLDMYVLQNSSTEFSYHFVLDSEKQKVCFEKIESVIHAKALDYLIAVKEGVYEK